MKIGIYGGTFDPPHLGHMAAAKAAAKELGLDKLIIVPAAIPPHKPLPQGAASAQARFDMARLMVDNLYLPGVAETSDLELRRPGVSYTCDTLQAIRERYPDARLWLLMGTDMFLSLHTWRAPEQICALAGICAFAREHGDTAAAFAAQRQLLERQYGAHVVTVDIPDLVETSSTALRAALAQGGGGEFLAPPVYGYILMHGLYGTHEDLKGLDLEKLRACSYSMILAKRIPHVRGAEEEAVRLARRWGADETLARRAAILHDCTKYLELEEQLALCAKYGVELDELERRAVKLLHSKTGACIARYVFGEPDEVYEAIFWHTTGKADMRLLDKVLYMADFIEPTRDFEGVELLRKLAYEDLDKAMLTGMEMIISDMHRDGRPIHRNTQAARDWLCEKGR